MRKGEAQSLKWSFVNGGEIVVPGEFCKSGEDHTIPILKKAWKTVCVKAGCRNLLFHDLRRSGVRDLIRAGVPQSVAMSISGHQTISMFNRYNITSTKDAAVAFEKVDAYRAG